MCGICGFTGELTAPSAVLSSMCESLVHRGPDESGAYHGSDVALGIRRLSIIDREGGHQPYRSEDGHIVAVFNGEIYGHRQLRDRLARSGHSFRSDADGEVIVHAYEEFGDAFLDEIDGMFAIALWDERKRTLLLARDRLGEKPLYWARRDDGGVTFASELQALWRDPRIAGDPDPDAIAEFLRFGYVASPRTIFRGIEKVAPGTLIKAGPDGVSARRYWSLSFEPKQSMSHEAAVAEFDARARDSVAARLMSEVPLGVFLSGGLDSSYVLGHLCSLSELPVQTFSIGFDDPRYDERPYARAVASHLGAEHHDFVITPRDLPDGIRTLARHFGEPFADPAAVPTLYLAREARRTITVALTGDGGDEILGGYDRHFAARLSGRIDRLPDAVQSSVAAGLRGLGFAGAHEKSSRRKLYRLVRSLGLSFDARFEDWSAIVTRGEWTELFPDLPLPTRAAELLGAATPLDRALATDTATYLPDDLMLKTDITTMTHSLEARAPLLEHTLVEWAATQPVSAKQRGRERKRLLRDALRQRVPFALIDRPKSGFAVPIRDWLAGDLRPLLVDAIGSAGAYVDTAAFERLAREQFAGTADRSRLLWSVLVLGVWHDEVVAGRPRAIEASV
jgi:asparagine synthase (glutamine-hydrolysing)